MEKAFLSYSKKQQEIPFKIGEFMRVEIERPSYNTKTNFINNKK